MPRGTTPLAVDLAVHRHSGPPTRPPAITGGARLRLPRSRSLRCRFGQGLGEDGRGGLGTGLAPSPARSCVAIPAAMFPSSPLAASYTHDPPRREGCAEGRCQGAGRASGARGGPRNGCATLPRPMATSGTTKPTKPKSSSPRRSWTTCVRASSSSGAAAEAAHHDRGELLRDDPVRSHRRGRPSTMRRRTPAPRRSSARGTSRSRTTSGT